MSDFLQEGQNGRRMFGQFLTGEPQAMVGLGFKDLEAARQYMVGRHVAGDMIEAVVFGGFDPVNRRDEAAGVLARAYSWIESA